MDIFERYASQISLSEMGEEGQKNIANSSVFVVGTGGVATGALPLLAGAGVGKLIIADGDKVSLNNLHRQTFFYEEEVGQKKSIVFKQKLQSLNSHVKIEAIESFVDAKNIESLIKNVDVCMDCSDNFETRILLSDYCLRKNIPYIYTAAEGWNAMSALFEGKSLHSLISDNSAIDEKIKNPIFPPCAHFAGVMSANLCLRKLAKMQLNTNELYSFDLQSMHFSKIQF